MKKLLSSSIALENMSMKVFHKDLGESVSIRNLKRGIQDEAALKKIYVLGAEHVKKKEILKFLMEAHFFEALGFYHHHLISLYAYEFLNHLDLVRGNERILKKALREVEIKPLNFEVKLSGLI